MLDKTLHLPTPQRDFTPDHAVVLSHLTKSFGEGDLRTPVIKGIDLEVRLGELLMIVGPSGCGKTTLLSIMAGTLASDRGEVEVFGQLLQDLRESELSRFRASHIGFIFQQFNLIPTLDCTENVSIPLLINKIPRRKAEERARQALADVGLAEKVGVKPKFLSGGQQQRVAIARALVHEPRLLICDEPTSSLDSESGAKIMEILSVVAKNPNRCVVVVSHDPRIYKYADRIIEMEDGLVKRIHEDASTLN